MELPHLDVVRRSIALSPSFCSATCRAWKVAPALACGCTIVMKPSEFTPLTALVSPSFCRRHHVYQCARHGYWCWGRRRVKAVCTRRVSAGDLPSLGFSAVFSPPSALGFASRCACCCAHCSLCVPQSRSAIGRITSAGCDEAGADAQTTPSGAAGIGGKSSLWAQQPRPRSSIARCEGQSNLARMAGVPNRAGAGSAPCVPFYARPRMPHATVLSFHTTERSQRADSPHFIETLRARRRSRVREKNTCPASGPTDRVGWSGRFPPGVINTVPSLGSVGGAALSSHKDVDKVAFTGSTVTGRRIMAAAAMSNLKKVSLELGGKSPQLIFETANLDEGEPDLLGRGVGLQFFFSWCGADACCGTAATWAAMGVLFNTGQDCCAGSRVYVQDTIYDKFMPILVEKAKELFVGDGFDEKSGCGPVVSPSFLS